VRASHAKLGKVQIVIHEVHAYSTVIDAVVVLTFHLGLLLLAHLLIRLHRELVFEAELLLLLLML